MCDKDFLKANIVICEKCSHEARLCRNPNVGVRKLCKGAPAIVFNSKNPSPEFFWWVSKVCKTISCSKFNKPVTLSDKEFKSLNPPNCPVCKQKMKPDKDTQSYFYKCETCGKIKPLADLLPIFEEILKK
jgi:hypothetical protein